MMQSHALRLKMCGNNSVFSVSNRLRGASLIGSVTITKTNAVMQRKLKPVMT